MSKSEVKFFPLIRSSKHAALDWGKAFHRSDLKQFLQIIVVGFSTLIHFTYGCISIRTSICKRIGTVFCSLKFRKSIKGIDPSPILRCFQYNKYKFLKISMTASETATHVCGKVVLWHRSELKCVHQILWSSAASVTFSERYWCNFVIFLMSSNGAK